MTRPTQYRKKPTRQLGIGARIRARREALAMSQADLARALDCAANTIYFLETGMVQDPHASMIIDAAKVLRVSSDYLLGLSEAVQVNAPRPRVRRKRQSEETDEEDVSAAMA